MMNIRTVFPIEELEKNIELGFVSKRKHPELPLYIYNYTNEAIFANEWNDVTRVCRGLILDEDYNIVARPFKKFFNLNTESEPSTHVDNLPKEAPIVTEKMDGSLGIYWSWKGYEGIATRGSFSSEQAIWATKHWNVITKLLRWKFYFDPNITPCFEIIFPENRIIVNYTDQRRLCLLGIVNNNDGSEYSYQDLLATGYPDVVKTYEGKSLSDCVRESEMDIPLNMEGYVLCYYGIGSPLYPLRVKIKLADYLRIHRLIFSLNDKLLWEMLRDGIDPTGKLDGVPPDAAQWIDITTANMLAKYRSYKLSSKMIYDNKPSGSRKDIAMYFKNYPELQSICFAMLDNMDYEDVIWKKIKPEKATSFRKAYGEYDG
jgi:hypothetical protein